MILPWPDFETLRDKPAAGEEFGENLGEQSSGGSIYSMEFYQNRSGKRIFDWIGAFL